jgi:hypothetical protein
MGHGRNAEGFSLRRWSQRKLAAARDERANANVREPALPSAPPAGERQEAVPVADVASPASAIPVPANGAPPAAADAEAKPALPPVESLTFDSDFAPFMQPGVDETVRRSALRKLLRDPRFNVMDGLDVYIDDYSKPSPIEPEVVRTLWQARYLFDPPKTRVTADGVVEDVPEQEAGMAADAAAAGDALPAAEAVVDPRHELPREHVPAGAPGDVAEGDEKPAVQRRETES